MIAETMVYAASCMRQHPLTACLFLLVSAILYLAVIFPMFLSPLRDVPGPYLYRISRYWALNGQRTHKWISTVYQLHQEYGEVVLLSPEEVSVNGDYKYIQDIYIRNFPKLRFYENFRNHGFKDNIFLSLENDRHLKYKKVLLSLYQKGAIFAPSNPTRAMLVAKVASLVDQVHVSSVSGRQPDFINARLEHNKFGKGYVLQDGGAWLDTSLGTNIGIDMYSLFALLAMDVVLAFELGVDNGTTLLSHPEDRHIICSHRLQAEMGFWTTLMPRWWKWAATAETVRALAAVEAWQLKLYARAERNVPKRVERAGKPANLTTLETLKANGFHGVNAYSFLSDNIFAGHETTATLLAYLTYELSRPCHSELQQKLKAELDDAFGPNGAISISIIDDLETVDGLKFVDALFQENLRLHASIPGAEPRVTNRAYAVGAKTVIPEGTTISCQPYSLHRQADVFHDAERFVPQRWLQEDSESDHDYRQRIIRQQKHMMPFGKGIRMCLGFNLAMIEMKLALVNLYWNFRSQISPDWCAVNAKSANAVALAPHQGASATDEDKMRMVDAYTTRPLHDELWLRWYHW